MSPCNTPKHPLSLWTRVLRSAGTKLYQTGSQGPAYKDLKGSVVMSDWSVFTPLSSVRLWDCADKAVVFMCSDIFLITFILIIIVVEEDSRT